MRRGIEYVEWEPDASGFIFRTCWIYNLCGSIRIYKDQINIIDPYADL